MKLRIYKAMPVYHNYLRAFCYKHPGLGDMTFNEQLRLHREDCFQWILSWQLYNYDPNVEIFETISNDFLLQNAWAGHRYHCDEEWEKSVVLEQIKAFRPHICIVYPPEQYGLDFIGEVRELIDGVLVGGYDGMNRQKLSVFEGYDFVLTCSPYISKNFERIGKPTYAMSFGFDKSVLDRIEQKRRKYEVSFSGSIFPDVHYDRFELINYVQKKVDLTISSEFAHVLKGKIAPKRAVRQLSALKMKDWMGFLKMSTHNIGPYYGLDMFQFLSDSAITINVHGDTIGFAANIRLYEATGVGTCLVTDWKDNLGDLFVPDKEVLVYRSKEEAVDKIKFALGHPDYLKRISENGQKRTLSNYSYEQIVPSVISFMKGL